MKKRILSVLLSLMMLSSILPMSLADAMMYCRFCGKQINADSIFCQYCGGKVGGDSETAATTTESAASTSGAVDYDELAKKVLKIENYNKDGELTSTGSGVVVFESNVIVTNYHVISDFDYRTAVVADNGESVDVGSILIFDEGADLAILQLDAPTSITPCTIGDSENLKRGDETIAIGSPLGLLNTVSTGIVSGFVQDGDLMDIQTTAPISHGSSGGALLNKNGDLIGITFAISEGGENIGYAIPAYEVQSLWDEYQAMPEEDRIAYSKRMSLMKSGQYDEARTEFLRIGDSAMARECLYLKALSLYQESSYEEAIALLEGMAEDDYKEARDFYAACSIGVALEYLETDRCTKVLKGINILIDLQEKGYVDVSEYIKQGREILLNVAISAYEGKTSLPLTEGKASGYFQKLANSEDFENRDIAAYYLLLCKAKNGDNLTYAELNKLYSNLDYADTKEALMYNHSIARSFLLGKWYTSNGYKYHWTDTGITDTLPSVLGGSWHCYISEGIAYKYADGSDRSSAQKDKKITIIDYNTIEVYCYRDSKTYTLTRSS